MRLRKKIFHSSLFTVFIALFIYFPVTANTVAAEINDLPIPIGAPNNTLASTSLESRHFVYHSGDNSVNAFSLLGQVPESIYVEMAGRYRYKQRNKIDIYVYSDRDKFLEESPSKNAVGYAVPYENKIAIFMGGNPRDWQTTLAHEINHIIFIQSVPKINTVPQWFIEGLAIYESHPGAKVARLEEQALAKDLPDIISLQQDATKAEPKDYGQGYLLIGFIVNEYGREGLDGIIAELQSGSGFNTAVTRALSTTPQELNNRSKSFMRTELFYVWLLKLQDFVWYFATALFIIAGIIAFVRKRNRLSRSKDDDDDDVQGSGYGESDKRFLSENEFEGVDFGDGAMV